MSVFLPLVWSYAEIRGWVVKRKSPCTQKDSTLTTQGSAFHNPWYFQEMCSLLNTDRKKKRPVLQVQGHWKHLLPFIYSLKLPTMHPKKGGALVWFYCVERARRYSQRPLWQSEMLFLTSRDDYRFKWSSYYMAQAGLWTPDPLQSAGIIVMCCHVWTIVILVGKYCLHLSVLASLLLW